MALFFGGSLPITVSMRGIGGLIAGGLAMAGRKSPWGNRGEDRPDGEDEPSAPTGGDAPPDSPSEEPKGPRNPWLPPSGSDGQRRSAGIEDIFRARKGGGDGGGGGAGFPRLPPRPGGKSWTPVILGTLAVAWIGLTSYHQLEPKEQGIVTTFGKYSRTLGDGVSWTLPWPFQVVSRSEATQTKFFTIPDSESEKLMLTSDQSLVNLRYLVRWYIKDLKLYTFQLEDTDATLREVAEAAMRASVAEEQLREVMGGGGQARIGANVQRRMQALLDAYKSGVQIQGVDIQRAVPPNQVDEAFQQVTVAQQEAQRDLSRAQAYAKQVVAKAEGETSEFNALYEQYRLSPEVTRRRMYYQTMEQVLSNNDKVVVEANGVTPYLPLPELRRRAAEAPPPAATPSGGGR
jgi:membrane protease subunit HflK